MPFDTSLWNSFPGMKFLKFKMFENMFAIVLQKSFPLCGHTLTKQQSLSTTLTYLCTNYFCSFLLYFLFRICRSAWLAVFQICSTILDHHKHMSNKIDNFADTNCPQICCIWYMNRTIKIKITIKYDFLKGFMVICNNS